MLLDPYITTATSTSLPTFAVGTSTSFGRIRQSGLVTEYVATNGVASATQPLYMRVTQKKRVFGVQGPAKYRVDFEYHIDQAAVNGVPQADRPIRMAIEVEGNTLDLTAANVGILLNLTAAIVANQGSALLSGQS